MNRAAHHINVTRIGAFARLSSDNHYTLLTHDLMNPVLLQVKTCTKTHRYMDTLVNNHTSKLGTFANTNTGHQNGVIYRRILLNLNAR